MQLRDKEGTVVLDTQINSIDDLHPSMELDEQSSIIVSNHKNTMQIENHIYKYYPQKKQSQDEKWFTLYSSKLKALSIQDVDTKIIQMTDAIFENKQLQDLLEDIPDEQKPYFQKLVKVSSRIQWAELCISEFQSAFAQNKQALLPDFPEFE